MHADRIALGYHGEHLVADAAPIEIILRKHFEPDDWRWRILIEEALTMRCPQPDSHRVLKAHDGRSPETLVDGRLISVIGFHVNCSHDRSVHRDGDSFPPTIFLQVLTGT